MVLGLVISLVAIASAHGKPPTAAEVDAWRSYGLRVLTEGDFTLVTDLPSSPAVDELPRVFSKALPQWQAYLEPAQTQLAPAGRDDWHLVGCLIGDRGRFEKAGLWPADLPEFPHGYQRGQQFWLYEQPSDYYRRHLFLHEATHALVERLWGQPSPPWFTEGLAELLATHRWQTNQLQLNVIPSHRQETEYWGRIKVLREAWKRQQFLSFAQVTQFDGKAHAVMEPYAWSWAACLLLDHHPRYHKIQSLRGYLGLERTAFYEGLLRELSSPAPAASSGEGAANTPRSAGLDGRSPSGSRAAGGPSAGPAGTVSPGRASAAGSELWGSRSPAEQLEADWQLMLSEIDYGYSVSEGGAELRRVGEVAPGGWRGQVLASRGWQATGLAVSAQETIHLKADGRVVLGRQPTPWEAEPEGITIDYYQGRPLGELTAIVLWDTPTAAGRHWSDAIPVGREGQWSVDRPGQIFLRVNERPGQLGDNQGLFEVEIRRGERRPD